MTGTTIKDITTADESAFRNCVRVNGARDEASSARLDGSLFCVRKRNAETDR